MPRDPVLIDTWALLALIDRADQWHQQAVEMSRQLSGAKRSLVITEWILTEFLGAAARPPLRALAQQSVDQFRAASRVSIVEATHGDWSHGFALYQARPDKTWSLVDCISIYLGERLGIAEIFTGDHHFEQAGLTILLHQPD
jgi:predicted nucleic acid-binding protein